MRKKHGPQIRSSLPETHRHYLLVLALILTAAFAVLLIVGIAVSAFGWRSALWAGGVAALWPLLSLYGVTPLPDAPVSWVILGATWTLVLAVKRSSLRWAAACGVLIGASCWLRA